jgi:hypothetical protein
MLTQDNTLDTVAAFHVEGGFDTGKIFESEGREASLSESSAQENEAPEATSDKVEPEQISNGDEFVAGNWPQSFEYGYDPATDKTVLAFRSTIADCENKGRGYRTALNETLAFAYKAYFLYANGSAYSKETIFEILKEQVLKKGSEYTKGKTEAEHMILELTFGEMTTATKSQRARLFRLAYSKKEKLVSPEYFPVWLGEKGGIVNALKPKNPKSSETLEQERKQRKQAMRLKVCTYVLGEVKDIPVKGLNPVKDKSLALAVIERNTDGTFVVLGFTDDEFAVDTACNAYGKGLA